MKPELMDGDAPLIVDVQNDFCPGGRWRWGDGDAVVPVLNEWIAAAMEVAVPVIGVARLASGGSRQLRGSRGAVAATLRTGHERGRFSRGPATTADNDNRDEGERRD